MYAKHHSRNRPFDGQPNFDGGCDKSQSSPNTTGTNDTAVPMTKPDNTSMNKRDQNSANVTPMDQSEDAGDIKITADIRRAVMDDKGLSTNADNAKIITGKGGSVTLRGVVDSATEKDSVETKAKGVTGVNSVDNQLEIKNP